MRAYLETERLLLRWFEPDDVENLVELDSDPEVMRYINGGPATPRTEVEERILPGLLRYDPEQGLGFWAGVEKSTGQFIGWFELRPIAPGEAELGYRLRRAAWGKGYATEGAQALVQKAFRELGLHRVVAFTMTVNRPSRRVMEKAGLKLVRTFFEPWPEAIPGSEHGDVEYAISKADWKQR